MARPPSSWGRIRMSVWWRAAPIGTRGWGRRRRPRRPAIRNSPTAWRGNNNGTIGHDPARRPLAAARYQHGGGADRVAARPDLPGDARHNMGAGRHRVSDRLDRAMAFDQQP